MSRTRNATAGFYGFSTDPSKLTYHPVGNSPPVDLTEGRPLPPQPPQLLLLGCGDIRSLLYTAHLLHTTCPPDLLPPALHFHLNDVEAGVLARDLLLLRLASTERASRPDSQEAQFLWSVWYECLLNSQQAARLKDVLKDLVHDVDKVHGDDITTDSEDDVTKRLGDDVTNETFCDVTEKRQDEGTPVDFRFGNEETRDAVKEALEEYGRLSVSTANLFKGRNEVMEKMNKSSDRVGEVTRRIASVFQEQQGCMKDPQLRLRCRKEIEGFVRTGMTSVPWSTRDEAELRGDYTGNPTYFRPGSATWCVPESACVFLSRDLDLDASDYPQGKTTLSSLLFSQMVEHVASFQKLQRQRGVKMTFTLWHGEALQVSESVLPASLQFDFINTSNLADKVGLLNLLVTYCSRLRPGSGLLSLQSFLWRCQDSLPAYVKKSVPVDTAVFQTVFGARWEGEDGQENCRTLRLGTFVGSEAVRFFFRSVPAPNERLTLTQERVGVITQALGDLFTVCAQPTCQMLGSRPLVSGMRTFLHAAQNLARRIEGGFEGVRGVIYSPTFLAHEPLLFPAVLPSLMALTTVHSGQQQEQQQQQQQQKQKQEQQQQKQEEQEEQQQEEQEDEEQQQQKGTRWLENRVVEVTLPVEIVAVGEKGEEEEEELHYCFIILTPFESYEEAVSGRIMNPVNEPAPSKPGRPLFIIKDFSFDHLHGTITFVFDENAWLAMPPYVNACFENCVPGKRCLLRRVPNIGSVASVRSLPRSEGEAAAAGLEESRPGRKATRRGIASLQLVEHSDHFTVSIRAAEAATLEQPSSISGGESPRHVRVTAGKGRSGLLWKAVLPCEVRADLSSVELSSRGEDPTVEVYILKDETALQGVPVDVKRRPLDVRRLPSYSYNRHSELTLCLNFWRAIPMERLHLGVELWPQEVSLDAGVRDLMLEVMHKAIHGEGSSPLVVSLDRPKGEMVEFFLLLRLHGFRVLSDGQPALVVTVLWPAEGDALMKAGKLRPRMFKEEMDQMLRIPHSSIPVTPLVRMAIPPLIEHLNRCRRLVTQDPSRDLTWIFQSFLRPCYASHSSWLSRYIAVNGADVPAEALKALVHSNKGSNSSPSLSSSSLSLSGCVQEHKWCCSREDFASMCLKCLLASGKEFHHMEKNTQRGAQGLISTGFPVSMATVEGGSRPMTCSYCKSQQDNLNECQSCHEVGYCCDECLSLDSDRHKTSCPSPSFCPDFIYSSLAAKLGDLHMDEPPATPQAAGEGRDAPENVTADSPTLGGGDQSKKTADPAVSWWKPGAKVPSSRLARGRRRPRGTKPDSQVTSTTKVEGERAKVNNDCKPEGGTTPENSSVSWWTSSPRVQGSGGQESRPAGETRRAAAAAAAEETPDSLDVILRQAGIRRCDVCRKPSSALKRCGRCKKRSYCSGDCQAQDWKEHRKSCTALP